MAQFNIDFSKRMAQKMYKKADLIDPWWFLLRMYGPIRLACGGLCGKIDKPLEIGSFQNIMGSQLNRLLAKGLIVNQLYSEMQILS